MAVRNLVSSLMVGLLLSGCTTLSLERQTIRQSASTSDLQYQEVMDNLAMIACDPAFLPSYSTIFAGTTDVSDTISLAGDSFWTRTALKTFGTVTNFSQDVDFL